MDKLEWWLNSIGLGKRLELFRANDLDLDIVAHLTEADLVGLGLSLGDRKRLMLAAGTLATNGAAAARHALGTERRRLTFMFCDLVGSTELSRRLDAMK